MFCPQNGEHVGPEMGPRAAGISQLCRLPPRVGMQTLQDRRKSCRLARPWMSKNHEVRGKAYTEPQVRGSNGVKREAAAWPTWCMCVPGSAVHWRGSTHQETLLSLSLQPHKPPRLLLELDLGSRDPRCNPVQLLLCCIMQTCGVSDLSKSCSHSHPTGPLQTVWISLPEVLHMCLTARLNHAWQTTKIQIRVAMNNRLRQRAHPRHYLGIIKCWRIH